MFFDKSRPGNTGLLFTCDTGIGRTTLGMIMGTLLLAHKYGFNSFMRLVYQAHSSLNKYKIDFYLRMIKVFILI